MTKRLFYVFLLFNFINTIKAQESTSVKDTLFFKNLIGVTNNGISFIPTFSLGKPATIFNLSVGNKRLSFEPELRFAIEDVKPWTFIFWLRYKVLNKKKFKLGVGVHPAFGFNTTSFTVDGIEKEFITTKRFLAGEIVPTYFINKKVSVGLYYLYSNCLDAAPKNNTFISANGYFSNLKLFKDYLLKFIPQVYYLKLDSSDGFYTASTLSLTKNKFPFSLSSTLNKKINSKIPSDDFVWNITLTYHFGGKYALKK